MKKLLLFSCILFFNFSFTQTYLPFLEENNKWNVNVYVHIFQPPSGPCCYTVTREFTLGPTEIVNNIEYYRVLLDGNPSCLLREENGVVYKFDETNLVDRVLFDFTLETGETFELTGSAYDNYPYCNYESGPPYTQLIVESVDNLMIAGEIRKVITFTEYGFFTQFQWIEGIGNITGFDLIWEEIDFTDGSLLVCFEQAGTNTFFNNATSCDNTTLSVTEADKENIILYPNPVTATSILQIPESFEADRIEVYSVSGKLVTEDVVSKNYYLFDTMKYRSGLYFYKLYSRSEVIKTDKFIIR
jgi:hypothetical protein